MVRKSAGAKVAKEATDLKIDPATADLYVLEKKATQQDKVNLLTKTLHQV